MDKEEKIKAAERKAEQHFGNSLMNMIIAKTYARHAKLTEEEFLKAIGFENSGKTEDEAVRIAVLNVLIEATNQFLRAKESLKGAHALMKTYLIDENITEKGEK